MNNSEKYYEKYLKYKKKYLNLKEKNGGSDILDEKFNILGTKNFEVRKSKTLEIIDFRAKDPNIKKYWNYICDYKNYGADSELFPIRFLGKFRLKVDGDKFKTDNEIEKIKKKIEAENKEWKVPKKKRNKKLNIKKK